jgi:hypothetical protein
MVSNSIVFSSQRLAFPDPVKSRFSEVKNIELSIDPKHKDVHWQLETVCGESGQNVSCIAQETVLPR